MYVSSMNEGLFKPRKRHTSKCGIVRQFQYCFSHLTPTRSVGICSVYWADFQRRTLIPLLNSGAKGAHTLVQALV